MSEKGREHSVHPLGNIRSLFQKILWRFGIELGIGAEKCQEISKAPFEAHVRYNIRHFCVDSLYLLKTNPVNLCRCKIECCIVLHLLFIVSLAVGKLRGADSLPRVGDIFAHKELEKGSVSLHRRFHDSRLSFHPKPFLMFHRHRHGECLKRLVENTLLRFVHHMCLDGDLIAVQHHFCYRHPGFNPLPHKGYMFIYVSGNGAEA